MTYVPPTFTALSAELQSSEEVGVVARHFIETRSEADLVALLVDGLRLHRQLIDVTQALTGALHACGHRACRPRRHSHECQRRRPP